jgi:hypothetical protein
LLDQIRARLDVATGLRVIICTPKFPDFAAGYEPMPRTRRGSAHPHSRATRRARGFVSSGRFSGRPSRLESMVVIVDDVWALIGSSSFRRRGLTFDGGSDLVFTDTDLVSGRLRRLPISAANSWPQPRCSRFGDECLRHHARRNFIRLNDGVEAFAAIREMLIAGGLGKIERLWNGELPGVTAFHPRASRSNHESRRQEFDLATALASAPSRD